MHPPSAPSCIPSPPLSNTHMPLRTRCARNSHHKICALRGPASVNPMVSISSVVSIVIIIIIITIIITFIIVIIIVISIVIIIISLLLLS